MFKIDVYTTSTKVRVTEHAVIYEDGVEVAHSKYFWYNRPWYRFTYQNALNKAMRECGYSGDLESCNGVQDYETILNKESEVK